MKAGVVYPQIELGGDIGAVKAFAQAAEDPGYDHIVIYDHVLGAVRLSACAPLLTNDRPRYFVRPSLCLSLLPRSNSFRSIAQAESLDATWLVKTQYR